MLFYLISGLIVVADQIIKQLVHTYMAFGSSIPLIGILKLTYVKNTGAAFSLFTGFTPYLSLISILVIVVVIYFHHKTPVNHYLMQIGLSFVLGGSIGNLIDRLFRSYVIDYIDFTYWPVFNLADSMINIGVLLIIINLLIKEKKNAVNSI
jgi:signal peptidase II